MIAIDTNALIILLVGLIDEELINKHKRTSIYNVEDFHFIQNIIGSFENLLVVPNVWTEVDNLLNNFNSDRRFKYISLLKDIINYSTERYIESKKAVLNDYFFDLGVTDALLLEISKECGNLITADTTLSDIATAHGIFVYDVVKNKNLKFISK